MATNFSHTAPHGPPWVRQLRQMNHKILLSSRSKVVRGPSRSIYQSDRPTGAGDDIIIEHTISRGSGASASAGAGARLRGGSRRGAHRLAATITSMGVQELGEGSAKRFE
eukprot:3930415-Pleurochrysis_carterae.AAC.1